MTALTTNGTAQAATTLTGAGKLFAAVGTAGTPISTKAGTTTQYVQIFALGTATAQTGVGSIPAPSDANFAGWLLDDTSLEGQRIAAGTWTPTFLLRASNGGTVTPTLAFYKRSSAGVYTAIGSVTGSSIVLTTSDQTLVFTAPSLALMDFAVGDKLCMWLWVNITVAGTLAAGTISVHEAASGSTSGHVGDVQAVTPGYAPTPVALTGTLAGSGTLAGTLQTVSGLYGVTVLADNPIRYYRLDESSGTTAHDVGSQSKNGTLTGSGLTLAQAGLLSTDSDTSYAWNGTNDSYITCADAAITSGSFTLEAWVYLVGPGSIGATGHADILAIGSFSTARVKMNTGNGSFTTEQGGSYQTTNLYAFNARHHVVLTWNGTVESFWIDGVQDSTFTPSSAPTWSGAFQIGSDIGNYCWNGRIDEIAIYSTALSAARIVTHYIAGTLTATFAGAGSLSPTLTASLTLGGATIAGAGTLAGTTSLSTALTSTLAGAGTLAGTLAIIAYHATGTLSGVGTLAGTMSANVALSTTMAGTGTLTGTLVITAVALSATVSGSGTLTGALSLSTALAGALAGIGTLSGTTQLTTALTTSLSGVGTLSATLTASLTLSGATMPGVGTLAGTLALSTALTDTFTGVGTLAGTLSLKTALATTMPGVGTLSGTLSASGQVALGVTLAGVGTLAGTAALSTALTSTMAGAGTLTGTLQASLALACTVAGVGTLAGSVQLATALTMTLSGSGTLTGTTSLNTALADTFTGVGTLTGTLSASGTVALAANVSGAGTLAGTLALSTVLIASMPGTGTLAGVFTIRIALSLTFAGLGTLTGAITVPILLYLSATATTRDMQATAKTRDMQALALTRDEKAIAKTRS